MSEHAVLDLFEQLLTSWNERDAIRYAALVADDGLVIGFDGSTMHGAAEVEQQLSAIFAHHQTAPYYWKVSGHLVRVMAAIERALSNDE